MGAVATGRLRVNQASGRPTATPRNAYEHSRLQACRVWDFVQFSSLPQWTCRSSDASPSPRCS